VIRVAERSESDGSVQIALTVNGRRQRISVEPGVTLVRLLREYLGLTGTHVGCDTAQCGACTILLGGRAVKSCNVLAVQADGGEITTIEAVAPTDDALHPIQEAFRARHALQCGFCTPGMVMIALELAARRPDATEQEIREALAGNLCRCTGYEGIVFGIRAALLELNAQRIRSKGPAPPGVS
jgi:carbon-monoxide dehydrogenase small subunit